MRLLRAVLYHPPESDNGILDLHFSIDGAEGRLSLGLPEQWAAWTRPQKIDWARGQIQEHLQSTSYATRGIVLYPDVAAPERAKDAFEKMPGWATWTAVEAEQWIENSVVDLASAKRALGAMVKAIVYLRDIVIER